VAVLAAMVVGDLLILSFGQSPGSVYRLLLEGTWGNAYGFGQVLYKTTTLTFTGLAVALALRAGLFNIGAEGQLAAGGIMAAVVGLLLPAGVPGLIAVPLCIVAAAFGGGVVGAVPGALKARFGAHEVIVTIMLNFIVLALLNWIVAAHLHVPETLHSPDIHAGAVPRLNGPFTGSAANWIILLAVATAPCGSTCSARGAATSCAPWASSPTRPSMPACAWAACGCARWPSPARWPGWAA
jgi:simple sugar transport system permease protein